MNIKINPLNMITSFIGIYLIMNSVSRTDYLGAIFGIIFLSVNFYNE